MSEIDYEELIRSPLDDLDASPPSPWGPILGGLVTGLLVGFLTMMIFGGGAEEPITAATSEATTTTTASTEAVTSDYPERYVEIAPGVAARPEAIFVDDNTVTVAFTSVVGRGDDPAATTWPRGGAWLLETQAGVALPSSRVVFGAFSPGAFSVQFPAANLGRVAFDRVRLLERWDTVRYTGSATVAFPGQPFEMSEELSIPVSQELTLVVSQFQLGRFSGTTEWLLSGAEMGANVDMTAVLFDEGGNEVGTYVPPTQIIEPASEGLLHLNWQRPFPYDQEGAVSVSLEYVVDAIEVATTDIELPLVDVSVVR